MKYLSEKTNKVYGSIEELEADEKAYEAKEAEKAKLLEEKKSRAKEVEDAYEELLKVKEAAYNQIAEAEKKYIKLRDKFAEDYNGYHMTYINNNGKTEITFGDLLADFYKSFNW